MASTPPDCLAGDEAFKRGAYTIRLKFPANYAVPAHAQPTTIVLYGQGPVEFKYVNPSDDPRHSKSGA